MDKIKVLNLFYNIFMLTGLFLIFYSFTFIVESLESTILIGIGGIVVYFTGYIEANNITLKKNIINEIKKIKEN